MAHHHHHHHAQVAEEQTGKQKKVLVLGILLNTLYVVVEAVAGFREGSLGLLSDAGHNLSDVLSLFLSLLAVRLALIPAGKRFTYGYKKAGILIALVNSMLLLGAVGAIVAEAIRNIGHPSEINGVSVSIIAGVGIIVNALTAFLLMGHSRADVNMKGAFLHMAADALVSVGVVIAGVIIHFTGWTLIDPIISLVVAAVILVSTFGLLTESLGMAMDAVPESVDCEAVAAALEADENISGWHHLHIWALGTTDTALTVHLELKDMQKAEETTHALKARLKELGIGHPTIETESPGSNCEHKCC